MRGTGRALIPGGPPLGVPGPGPVRVDRSDTSAAVSRAVNSDPDPAFQVNPDLYPDSGF